MGFPWIEFVTILGAFTIGAISPGPDFAMVLRHSISHGRGAAIATSAGIGSAILVHGTYTILGLGLIVSRSVFLFSLVKYVGAAYLIWLGLAALRAAKPGPPANPENPDGPEIGWIKAFSIGFLTNLLNPKAVLFFVALFSVLVSTQTALIWQAIYILAMAAVLFVWFTLVSLFFTAPKVRSGFYGMGQWFNRASGVAFILLALSLALTKNN